MITAFHAHTLPDNCPPKTTSIAQAVAMEEGHDSFGAEILAITHQAILLHESFVAACYTRLQVLLGWSDCVHMHVQTTCIGFVLMML